MSDDERRKAEFLTAYRALCQRHWLMVIMDDEDGASEYQRFAVADIRNQPRELDKAVDEMLIGDMIRIGDETP